MVKRSKFVYIIGSVIIGIISIIFIFAGLALSGVIDAGTTKLILKSASADKIYDGQVLTCEDWSIVDGALKKGHTAKVVMLGEQTNAGESENKFDITITDKNGADVTEDYKIVTEFGTLTVNPFPLTVQSGSAEKDYDGTPLTFNEYTVESFRELLEGHEILVNITGSAVSRDAKNKIADVRVLADGVDVTHNYDITKIEGDLVIKGAPEGAAEGGGEVAKNGAGEQSDESLFYITTDLNQNTIYLREKSFGDYSEATGNWSYPTIYANYKEVNPLYYSGLALKQGNATAYSLTVEIAEENSYGELTYLLPYYVPASLSEEKNDTKLSLSGLTEYTVEEFYAYDYFSADTPVTLEGTQLAEYEKVYRAFVLKNYLTLPEYTKTKMQEIAETNGIDKESATLIQDVASLVQNYLPYDLEAQYEDNVAVYFFEGAESAFCQQYATAATAMYRALDIPARYTIGYAAKNNVGKSSPVSAQDYHAWVEVYMDGFGWVPVEVTGGYGNDQDEIDDEECDLIIRAMNRSQHIDDGDTLTANPDGWYIEKNELNLGVLGVDYEIVATVVGEQVGIGKSDATIDIGSVAILKDGQDVTSQYTIKCKTGKLHIYKYKIEVSTGGAEKVYDGKLLTTAEDDYTIASEYLQLIEDNGHTISVVVNGEQTNVGTGVNVADIVITDESGKDVTDYYKITKNFGELKVTLLKMSITAGSEEKEYDGTELTYGEYTCGDLTVVDGVIQETEHTIAVYIKGSQTNVGQSANTVEEVVITDADGNDVTSNYLITNIDGTLTVLPSETSEE